MIKFENKAEIEMFKNSSASAYFLAGRIQDILIAEYFTDEPEYLFDGDKCYKVTVTVEEA